MIHGENGVTEKEVFVLWASLLFFAPQLHLNLNERGVKKQKETSEGAFPELWILLDDILA